MVQGKRVGASFQLVLVKLGVGAGRVRELVLLLVDAGKAGEFVLPSSWCW